MARSGPQKYPGASTAYWWQSRWGGDAMETNVIVWHSTEGTSLPDYGGGASAPNFTAKPDFKGERLVWYQHFDFDTSSRALVNQPGGVETNTLNVCQVEIVGTCVPDTHRKWGSTPHLYMPELPDWAIRDLADFAKWAHDQHGVPLTSGVAFKPPGEASRMSFSEWNAYRGHCGHEHVPENDHSDPGAFPMVRILAEAKDSSGPSQPKYEPFPGTAWFKKEPKSAIITAMGKRLVAEGCGRYEVGPGPQWTDADRTSYAAWQRKCGFSGSDADGWPGETTWNRLKVPNV